MDQPQADQSLGAAAVADLGAELVRPGVVGDVVQQDGGDERGWCVG
ncbi:hypothetical protein [Parafrankia soli]|nr:hypothetical protein [Parafrankia soli]